ncbi:MAG: asparagine synthase (glutamine-hydrolyzing) [Terriglobales bacterium]
MCGITGIVQFYRGAEVDPQALRRMCAAMAHRGPDDEGIYTQGRVGIAMRRLSIIDVVAGHQPLSNEDGTIWIVFNGEIYNHAALRQQLEARGHHYRTHCDTETIVHLYEEYGRDCVQHLRGMFAFAIWDSRKRCVFVARDRLGIKPLYYRATSGSFLFGSEVKVILAHPGMKAAVNRAVLPEYLAFGYISGEETFYKGIRKLMPGHTLELDENGTIKIRQYWDLPIHGEDGSRSEAYYVQRYREMLEAAVSSHLMSDVPLGVFLSGGVDSSAVAALTTRIRRAPVETFSVGYSEHAYSELPHARAVAKHIGAVHHEVLVSRDGFFGALPHLIWHEDEPIVWPSSVALFFVARLAAEHVKVVLTGEGADETLGGYTRYAFTRRNAALDRIYRSLFPSIFREYIRESVSDSAVIGATIRRKLSHTFLALDGNSWSSFYFDNFFSAFSAAEQRGLLTEEVAAQFGEDAACRNALGYWEHSSGDMLQRLLYTDIKTYLVELLMKQDNMSMAASIESRVPFLDHGLVEFAANIPVKFQLRGLAGKQVLKKAVEDLLPHSIIYRKKLGFPTPWSGWLAGTQLDDVESLLLEARSMDRGLFKGDAVERLFQEHRTHYRDNYDRIWRLLNLELWQRVCVEGDSHDLPDEKTHLGHRLSALT